MWTSFLAIHFICEFDGTINFRIEELHTPSTWGYFFVQNDLSERLQLDGFCPHYSPTLNLGFGLSVILSIRSSIH